MAIAVDQSYAADETTLTEEAEIVVIPPVSGG
jgi:molybdopterin converting factor small subunit